MVCAANQSAPSEYSFTPMSRRLRIAELCLRDCISGGPFKAAAVSRCSDSETMGERHESAVKKLTRMLTMPKALSHAHSAPCYNPITADARHKFIIRCPQRAISGPPSAVAWRVGAVGVFRPWTRPNARSVAELQAAIGSEARDGCHPDFQRCRATGIIVGSSARRCQAAKCHVESSRDISRRRLEMADVRLDRVGRAMCRALDQPPPAAKLGSTAETVEG